MMFTVCRNCGYHNFTPEPNPCNKPTLHPLSAPGNGFEGVTIYCTLPTGHGGNHAAHYGGCYSKVFLETAS